MSYSPTPPAVLPWDLGQIADDALEVLRLGTGDVDADRVAAAAVSATELIGARVDLPESPTAVAPTLHAAAVQVTIELYRRKDAPFGVVGTWSEDTVAFRVSSDPLAGVRLIVLGQKRRWGIA